MLIVQKYGGTSVADDDRIKRVAGHVVDTVKAGNNVVVVVSAMAGETDRLLKLGQSCHSRGGGNPVHLNEPDSCLCRNEMTFSTDSHYVDREMDALVATGEIVTAALTAMAVSHLGHPAISLNAAQVRIVTDALHQRAQMRFIETDRINKELKEGKVVVVAGFQGVTEDGDITTIGRGGSDTSAVALAAALHADVCEIYSDVDGLYSADPKVCKPARRIERASYEELLETAGAGAKVVHMHAVELAAKHDVPLRLKKSPSIDASAKLDKGTNITREDINMNKVLVSTVSHTSNEAKISVRSVPNRVGLATRLFEPLAKANINVDMIVQSISTGGTSDISFTIAKHDLKRAMQLTEVAAREIGAGHVEMAGDVAKISIVGIGMRSHAGIAAKMFEVLAREGIDIQMISTSEIKVSVVVDNKHMEKAVNALHAAFIS